MGPQVSCSGSGFVRGLRDFASDAMEGYILATQGPEDPFDFVAMDAIPVKRRANELQAQGFSSHRAYSEAMLERGALSPYHYEMAREVGLRNGTW